MPKLAALVSPDEFRDLLHELACEAPPVDSLEGLMQCMRARPAVAARPGILALLSQACSAYGAPLVSADVLERGRAGEIIPSGSECVDTLLNGGFMPGDVVELCGPSGTGKTQLCLLSAATTLSRLSSARVAYVDTCGSFSASRLSDLLTSWGGGEEVPPEYAAHALAHALGRVSVARPEDAHTLLGMLRGWEAEWDVGVSPPPTLLLLDSITATMSPVLGGADTTTAHALLSCLGIALSRIAQVYGVAVVVTNGTVSDRAGGGPHGTQPALGSTWHPFPTSRVWMEKDGGVTLLRCSRAPLATVTPS